ncbi:MAG: homoserine O-succinyltransferase [Lachnospiraceae bacterium]|nr:homoserine O-succinyltransferase [Lachnospiraceae bacterium]
MPIKVQSDLPAKETLERENIFVMDELRSIHQDIRPLKICILNLMPLKQDTELQLLRALSNTPLQIDITFLMVKSHESKNVSANHLNQFYKVWDEVKERRFDGMIITGAPVELMEFEEVDYWDELCNIFKWSKDHVTSVLHICWGAQAGLYYHYGIGKIKLPKKLSGIYENRVMNRKIPLVRGFDDVFLAPHSRYTGVSPEDVYGNSELMVLAESEEAGIYICTANSGSMVFVMGHPEYDRMTLDKEYNRDLGKGIDPEIPKNYYPGDDPSKRPLLSWRSHCNILYTNWLNYYVYQATPYDIDNPENRPLFLY